MMRVLITLAIAAILAAADGPRPEVRVETGVVSGVAAADGRARVFRRRAICGGARRRTATARAGALLGRARRERFFRGMRAEHRDRT